MRERESCAKSLINWSGMLGDLGFKRFRIQFSKEIAICQENQIIFRIQDGNVI
jgi:hypothetical protein